ncbi:integrase [Plasmopara halstedii]|uniref:Integrase n=1 Tax=Plasmopara halstedii TaxID=4781 RepID=A0A0P1AP35_PLAHL|nr:integrase [Plasmopara halstedii]CEG42924.1 integrase [Plasmopara halstedii]|eukprot:XP_024579293.1 integrase [Plasmopara halstedii]
MISRDVTFDESCLCDLELDIVDDVDAANLDFGFIEIEDDFWYTTNFKQTGLEEASAPDEMNQRRVKQQCRVQNVSRSGQEVHDSEDDKIDVTPSASWRASVNTVETNDLLEPTFYQDALNGPDRFHWRKAYHAELNIMQLRRVFRALPSGQHAIGTKWYSRSSVTLMSRLGNIRHGLLQNASDKNMELITWKKISPVDKCLNGFFYGVVKEVVYCEVPEGVELDSEKVDFQGHSDADWVGAHTDRKSISGYAFVLIGGPVNWGSKKQSSVSLSTSETENIALTLAVQEGKWGA